LRSERFGSPDRLPLNHWALAGEWTIGRESVVLDEAGGSIACRFHARDAHLVLSRGAGEPIPFRVLLDGEAPGPSHGVDVDEGGNGLLGDGRMYQLVRRHDVVRERTLEITFLEPGAEAYAFRSGRPYGHRLHPFRHPHPHMAADRCADSAAHWHRRADRRGVPLPLRRSRGRDERHRLLVLRQVRAEGRPRRTGRARAMPELEAMVQDLARRAQVPASRLYTIPS
jgi:hypothetical protein